MSDSGTLYLVDVMSLVFQVFHAIPAMTGPAGQPTNAVFGFTRDLRTLLEGGKATHLVCALDVEGPGVRHEMYEEYKANRSEMPDDLSPQIAVVERVMEGFRVPRIGVPGWEADDVIATLATRAAADGFDVVIVTSDKDARQLIGPRVRLFNMRKNQFLNADGLADDWGVRPDQVIDFQALVGDSVDNVPGVPLVGPKKARALLESFETLEGVLANADEAPGKKLRENLKTFADQARLSRDLVTLRTDLEIQLDWDDARIADPDRELLTQLFNECGFRRFADEIRQVPEREQTFEETPWTWTTVDTPDAFNTFLEALGEQQRFCVDLETTGLDAMRADIVGWAVSWQSHTAFYLPVQGPPGQPVLEPDAVLAALRPLLENPEVEICNQNLKYDMLVLRRAGVELRGVGLDPMVGHYLLDAGARSHGLDALAKKFLNRKLISIKELIGEGKVQKTMFEVDVDKAAEYAAEDADVAWQLSERIASELRDAGLWDLYWTLERPLIPVLVEMEYRGVRVDVDELKRQSDELSARLEVLVKEIHEIAGHEFNIGSPVQLRTVLFDELGLPIVKRTKTGPSTNADVLERLAALHPLPAKIVEHRQLAKLKGTYLDALPTMVNPDTGRVHCSFNQVVAATGRLSSSDPNLQNIPIRTEAGRRVRRAFVPADGHVLLKADYSQVELRMLAHFSGDDALCEAFRDGLDVHRAVAAEVFGVAPEDVDGDQRRMAKAVNFGVVYGQSPFGLAQSLGIPQDEAAAFIDGYFTKYAGVDAFMGEVLDRVRLDGFAETILGRRRFITGVRGGRRRQLNMPERTAVNTVIQGSAADLIKRAMITLHDRLETERHTGRMLLQIHDELVFEVPPGDVTSLAKIVESEMRTALDLTVPLVVDVSVGPNWLDTKDVPVGEATPT